MPGCLSGSGSLPLFFPFAAPPMQNVASRLALLAGPGGLALLLIAPNDDIRTPLGVALIVIAALLVGLGKGIDLLGYVYEGAADSEERP